MRSGSYRFPPLVRFFRADGQELLSESVPHFTSPPQRRYAPGRRRPLPLRGHLRRYPGRALLRPGPAPARPVGPEGGRHRPHPAQHRGLRTFRALQPRLRVPVEHARGGPGRARHQPDEVGRRRSPADRLLGDHGAHAGRHRQPATQGDRAAADAAGVGFGLLAVQAPLPGPRRAPRGRPRVQAPRAASLGDRLRLLPLDPPGRMEVRPRRVARPPGDGGRAARARGRADGLGLADGQPQQRRTTPRWTGGASWCAT